jgi:hypothetical protein
MKMTNIPPVQKLRMRGVITFSSPYIFTVWCLIKHRDILALPTSPKLPLVVVVIVITITTIDTIIDTIISQVCRLLYYETLIW